MCSILKIESENDLSNYEKMDKIEALGKDSTLTLVSSSVLDYERLAQKAIDKLLGTGHYPEFNTSISLLNNSSHHLNSFIDFAEGFESTIEPVAKSVHGLSYDFYLKEGGYLKNAQFLFGTPSQFRGLGRGG